MIRNLFKKKDKSEDIESRYAEIRKTLQGIVNGTSPTLANIIETYDSYKNDHRLTYEDISKMKDIVLNKSTNFAGLESDETSNDHDFQVRYTMYRLDMLIKMDGVGIDYHAV